MRRFHATLRPVAMSCWAALCVGFVECFKGAHAEASLVLDAPSLTEGLAALRGLQERATLAELRELMAPHLASSTIDQLVNESRGVALVPTTHATSLHGFLLSTLRRR